MLKLSPDKSKANCRTRLHVARKTNVTFSSCISQQRNDYEPLSWSQLHWYTTFFSSSCFSHQPPAPPPPPALHLPQRSSLRAASVKSQGCLTGRGVAAVNLCILGLIGCGASGPKGCQRLRRLTQLNLENDVETETICLVAANCSMRGNAARAIDDHRPVHR